MRHSVFLLLEHLSAAEVCYCKTPNLTSTQRLGLTRKWLCISHPPHTMLWNLGKGFEPQLQTQKFINAVKMYKCAQFYSCVFNHHPTPLVILAKNLDGNDLHLRSHSLPVSSFLSTIGPGRSYYPVSWAWGGWGVRQNIVVQSDSHIQLGQWCTDWICKLFSILEIFCDLGLGMDKMKLWPTSPHYKA